jgi:hypothetical protein
MYKKLRGQFAHEDENKEIIDFWFKERKQTNYIKLTTGEYKRQDLIDDARDAIELGTPPRKGWFTSITFVRAMKDYPEFLEKQNYKQLDEFPLVFNYGGMIWDGSKYETFPLGFHLRDAQILLNYCGSVVGDIMKSAKADKWFFNPEHIESAAAKATVDEINERECGLLIDGDISTIRREVSKQLPPGLMQMFQMLPGLVQNLAGSYFDSNSSEIKAMSGVALDKMFNRVDLVQNPVIVAHLQTLNKIGEILKKMIPIYYTQNRMLAIRNVDGEITKIEINKPIPQPNGKTVVENPISQLRDNYDYRINASPALRLQKQNVKNELEEIYKLYPPAIPSTVDLYVKSLDIPNADVIARRLSVNIPKDLVEYGNGTINYDQYQEATQQQQAQAQQQQMEQMAEAPQTQLMQAKAHSEVSKAQTDQFNAETARMKEHAASSNEHIKNVSSAVNVQMENEMKRSQQELEVYKAHMQQTDDVIEALGN